MTAGSAADTEVGKQTVKAVLLSGCGNIGYRHLQALVSMRLPVAICVVEPNPEQHDRIRAEFVASGVSDGLFELHSALPTRRRKFDLAVVATTASRRRQVIEEILERHDVSTMILEKVLFQTVSDLDFVASLLAKRDVDAYVNCGRRSFAGYRSLRSSTAMSRPVNLTVTGHRIGLASNAVHFLDLGEFLNDSPLVSIESAGLVPGFVPSKHPGCVEVFGTLVADYENGAQMSVESLDLAEPRIEVVATSRSATFRIDELHRTITIDQLPTTEFQSQNVSESHEIYESLLDAEAALLTPYRDSVRQHRLYLEALRDHLGLSNVDDEPCPIS